jgi:hypothetical protein
VTLTKSGSTEADYFTLKGLGGKVSAINLRPDLADWNTSDDFIFNTHVVNLVSLLPYGLKTTQLVSER